MAGLSSVDRGLARTGFASAVRACARAGVCMCVSVRVSVRVCVYVCRQSRQSGEGIGFASFTFQTSSRERNDHSYRKFVSITDRDAGAESTDFGAEVSAASAHVYASSTGGAARILRTLVIVGGLDAGGGGERGTGESRAVKRHYQQQRICEADVEHVLRRPQCNLGSRMEILEWNRPVF